jgi:hypothetical protein
MKILRKPHKMILVIMECLDDLFPDGFSSDEIIQRCKNNYNSDIIIKSLDDLEKCGLLIKFGFDYKSKPTKFSNIPIYRYHYKIGSTTEIVKRRLYERSK